MGKLSRLMQQKLSNKRRLEFPKILDSLNLKVNYLILDMPYRHIRIGKIDYWPATELTLDRITKKKYHGLDDFKRLAELQNPEVFKPIYKIRKKETETNWINFL
jgi:hypothetical protein